MKFYPKNLWVVDSVNFQVFMLDHLEGDVYVLDDRQDLVDYEYFNFSYKHPGYLVFQGYKEVAFNSDEIFRTEKTAYRRLEKLLNKRIKALIFIRNSLSHSDTKISFKFLKKEENYGKEEKSNI